ncbi:DUF6894 family protein [Rhizobium laguerreae]|uniref:DUF6894 family protein n=1 Tax=Rhizobium laguerreae TaxID=1076926 RepID=UPI0035E404AF
MRAVWGNLFDGGNHAEIFFPCPPERCLRGRSEGIDLASPELACEEATAAAREIVAERIRTGDPANGGAFEIMTEDGSLVATVPFRSAIHLD